MNETTNTQTKTRLREKLGRWIPPLLICAALLALLGFRIIPMLTPAYLPPQSPPLPPVPATATVDLGVATTPLGQNSWKLWQPSDLSSVDNFEQQIGKRVSI